MTTPNQPAPSGAFTVGGGDFSFGQDYTPTIIGDMFKIPFPTVDTAIDALQALLLKLPIEVLRAFKDIIPGSIDDDFLDVLTAVDTIIDQIQDNPVFVTFKSFIDGPMSIIITIINAVLDLIRSLLVHLGLGWLVPPDISLV